MPPFSWCRPSCTPWCCYHGRHSSFPWAAARCPVRLHQGRLSIGADAINNSVTLCYCRCYYYYSNYGKKQACYILTGNVSTLTVSVHTSVLDNSQRLDNDYETYFDVCKNRQHFVSPSSISTESIHVTCMTMLSKTSTPLEGISLVD